jgi:hypothetical protein
MEKSQTPIGPVQSTGFTSNTEVDTILDRAPSSHDSFVGQPYFSPVLLGQHR